MNSRSITASKPKWAPAYSASDEGAWQGQPTRSSHPVVGRGQAQAESDIHATGWQIQRENRPPQLISSNQLAAPTTARTMSEEGIGSDGRLRHSQLKGSVSDDLARSKPTELCRASSTTLVLLDLL